jgi:O-antigen ligase
VKTQVSLKSPIFRYSVVLLAVSIFAVPVCTDMLPYFFTEMQLLQTRPVVIILFTGMIAILSVMPFVPRPPLSLILLFALLMLRFIDAFYLRRMYDPLNTAISTTGFAAFILIVFVFCLGNYKRHRLVGPVIALTSFAITMGTVVWDVVFPGAFGNVIGRAAGLFINSNNAALAIAFVSSYLMGFWASSTILSTLFMYLGMIGTFVTYSRGGFAIMLLSAAIYIFRSMQWWKAAIVLCTILGVAYGLEKVGREISTGNQNIEGRALVMLGREMIDIDDTGRVAVLLEGLAFCWEQPFVGFGSTFSATSGRSDGSGPHNMIVAAWMDSGIIGLTLYLASVISLLIYVYHRSRKYLPLACALAVSSVFSHNLLEFAPFLFGWVLVVYASKAQAEESVQSQRHSSTLHKRARARGVWERLLPVK